MVFPVASAHAVDTGSARSQAHAVGDNVDPGLQRQQIGRIRQNEQRNPQHAAGLQLAALADPITSVLLPADLILDPGDRSRPGVSLS